MAQISTSKASMVFAIVIIMSAVAVSAQDSPMASSPLPSMDTGSAFSVSISGACSSVLIFAVLTSCFLQALVT
ncbi:hypothetical protein AQUCO_03400388v1 [Aquilegia coerulea]|uniref:Transmembrane protein n=1 Tax=Aquilegia coerulea TaxID=218851 RepID=A0A2G5CYW6_AQUCA|nr:hypothetical protein AQUCO_03400388v1 [Aquilegia coerulea]